MEKTGLPPQILLKLCIFNLAADDELRSLPALLQFPALGDSYHFSPPGQTYIRHSRDFYRVIRFILLKDTCSRSILPLFIN